MAITVNVSELKSRLSHYLRVVRRGEVVFVRDRDRIVARLEVAGPASVGPESERLDRLEQAGVLRRSRRRLDPDLLQRRVRARADVVGAVLAERDDGR